MKDMTQGKPAELLLRFFVPVFLGNLFQQLYTMTDTMIVGRTLGVNALAGVGSTGALNFMITGSVIGCMSGFGVVTGRFFGTQDYKEMRRIIAGSVYLSVIVTALLTSFTVRYCRDILDWMKTPPEIWQEAYNYIIIVLAGISATVIYNLTSSILRAVGDSRTPFIVLIISSVLNVVLDIVFMKSFHMGTAGAGFATVIAQALAALYCLIYMVRKYDFLVIQKDEWNVNLKYYGELLKQGIPMALQFFITAVGSLTLQLAINDLGADYVAGIASGTKALGLVIMAFEAMGIALCTYCSQNVGALQYERIVQGIRTGYKIQLIFCAGGMAFILIFGKYLALLFIDASETAALEHIVTFLRINAFALPFSATLGIFRYGLQGMGYSFQAMFAGVAEMLGRMITAFSFTALWGYAGACLGNAAAWLFADILLIACYMRIRRRPPYTAEVQIKEGIMKYRLSKDVMSNNAERLAFDELAGKIFDLSFDKWYKNGFWSDSNIPYTLFDGGRAAANVSVNKMEVLFDGEKRNHIQLGTVMTDEKYRNQGLAKCLINEVKKDWENKCDSMFLFANESVLEFYPKFGFEKAVYYKRWFEIEEVFGTSRKLDMDLEGDREMLKRYYEKTNPFSRIQVINNYGLLMFYCMGFMKECVLYSEKYDAVVIAEQEGECMHCYDIFCDEDKRMTDILRDAAGRGTKRVQLQFTPRNDEGFIVEEVQDDDNTLFVLNGKENIYKTEKLCFPDISHT